MYSLVYRNYFSGVQMDRFKILYVKDRSHKHCEAAYLSEPPEPPLLNQTRPGILKATYLLSVDFGQELKLPNSIFQHRQ